MIGKMKESNLRQRIYATWPDASGTRCAYRHVAAPRLPQGYGQTRGVKVIIDGTPPKQDAGTPNGKTLADLINVTVPIAAEHAGHRILIDSRTDPRELR